MFPIILVFILKESVDRSDNPTSRRNMNSRNDNRQSIRLVRKTQTTVKYRACCQSLDQRHRRLKK